MATQPDTTEPRPFAIEPDSGYEASTLDKPRIGMLKAIQAPNLVPLLDKNDVNKIGQDALREYEIDLASCTDFHKRYDAWMDMAMQVRTEKTYPWQNASNVIFPHLTTASIQFQARAYPAFIDGSNVVKGRVLGPDPDGSKRSRADRVAGHMSWQFLNDVPGWEEDTDRLLLRLPIIGCEFRKTWRDMIRAQNNSETVCAKDLVVNYKTASFDKAPRFTHIQRHYPHEIEAFVRSGEWFKVQYDGDDGEDPHSLVTLLEQHRLIDMDDDGLPEPYVVTLTEQGNVARIVACYDAEGIHIQGAGMGKQTSLAELVRTGQVPDDIKVVRIERREYFTKYGFIPAPDGSFYDVGFGFLIENLGRSINSILNQMIDAGTLANLQGGFIAGGTKIKSGNMRIAPGEWKRVEGVTAGPLRDNIMPLNLPGPSPVLFQLLGLLNEAVERITSVSDILTGNQETQTAPTTALALIEQGQKVYTAIYQRIHRSFGNDIKIMHRLNRDYLDNDEYFALNDVPMQVGHADYEDSDLDVVPVSDPRAINDRVKIAKAQVLGEHDGDPLINQLEIRKRKFEAVGIDNIPPLFDVPQPPPDPAVLADAARMANERDQTKADIRAKDALTAKTLIEAAGAAYQLGTLLADINITAQAQEMLNDAMALADAINGGMEDGGQPADQPGGIPGMEGPPLDAGISAIPDGPGDVGVDGMGHAPRSLGPDELPAGAGGNMGGPGGSGM